MKLIAGFVSVVLLSCFALSASAQSRQQQKTDSVFRIVKSNFNAKNVDALYALTGEKLKATLSPQAFKSAFERQIFPLGAIKADSVISFVNNKNATYKLTFDSSVFQLVMNLDDKDKLELFLFQPYTDAVVTTKPNKVPSSNPMTSAIDRSIDSLVRKYIQRSNTVGASVGIIKDGKTTIYNYGEVKKGSSILPDNSTLFELGSITKTFTATLLSYYANQEKINLQDPIIKFLPANVAANPELKDITVLQLSNHTSGLARLPDNFTLQRPYDEANPYKNYNKKLLFDYLSRATLNSKPGEKYAYSNMGVGLLGIILEKVSGKSFEQMVADVITIPLGMKNTIQHMYAMQVPRFAEVYDASGNATSAWDLDALASAGALRSTMNDMLIYARANMNSTGTTAIAKAINQTHQITFNNNDAKIGLGWHVSTINGTEYYFHGGGTGGSSSFFAFNASKKLAVIILSNAVESTDPLGASLIKKLQ